MARRFWLADNPRPGHRAGHHKPCQARAAPPRRLENRARYDWKESKELVETGESRTPRPETPLSGYATSLFGALVLLPPTPADGIRQRPADKICGPAYRRRWGSIPE